MFHLNLAFSSIEESERGSVIERCYWPLLALAATHGPIGIEVTGYTLEEIEQRDPAWITTLSRSARLRQGRAHRVGLCAAHRSAGAGHGGGQNLAIGNDIYRALLGRVRRSALVNEQAYSGGLVGHYLDAGYEGAADGLGQSGRPSSRMATEARYLPQAALGADGREIGLLWTNTVAFQKLQRYAHGDIALDDYCDFVAGRRGERRARSASMRAMRRFSTFVRGATAPRSP